MSSKVHFYTRQGPNISAFPRISSSLPFHLHSIGSCCQQFTSFGYCELCSFHILVAVSESFNCSQTNSKITQLKRNEITMGHTQPLCSTLYMSKSIDVILAQHAIPGATDHGRGKKVNNNKISQ